uniref:ictacalcin-like n=1 Tax=Doryrhamphus excisus TaxID=161450 RepID=UPI0025AE4EF2|nr:ictacalcin-like [Doryrhamphus excisus]
MGDLRTAMTLLMQTFTKYAGAEGDKCKLSKAEVKTLLEKEFDFKCAKNQGELNEFLKGLDFNGDSQIDFKEFMTIVVALTCLCHGC